MSPPLESFTSQRSSGYIRLIAVLLLIVLTVALGYALRYTLSCFLLSFVLAYLFDPLVVRMERRGIRRIHAIIVLYIGMALLTTFALIVMVPKLSINWNDFLQSLPLYLQRLKQLLLSWQDRLPEHYGSQELNWLADNITGNADKVAERAGTWAYGFGRSVFFNLFNVILSPILVFFMLLYKQKAIETSYSWIPEERRTMVLRIGREVDASIGGYLRGQVAVSLIVALLTIPSLWFLDVPHPLFCGIFAGFASILPFIGVIIAMLPPLLFAWLAIGTGAILLTILGVFSVIYFVEGYLIKPLIFKEAMNLNPLLTIIMVMALGELMGFWGILLALPITAALKIAWQHWLRGDFANPRNEP